MYEKPQYMTPDGYRRVSGNPNKDKGQKLDPFGKKVPVLQLKSSKELAPKKAATLNQSIQVSTQPKKTLIPNEKPAVAVPTRLLLQKKKPAMSEKSAQLIAMAIKSMLKNE